MAVGKPVICLDMAGASDIITPECGMKLAARTPAEVIAALAQAFERLAASPELCQKLGAAGRKHIQERFDWDRKGELIRQLYVDCLPPRSGRF
jgi:glycosyltransferase involved in cell wall biosynthesis